MSSINLLLNYTLINEDSLHPSIKYRLKLVKNREIKEDSKNSQSNNILNIISKITNKKEDKRRDECKNDNYLILVHQKITKDLFVDPYQLEQHKEYYKDYFKNKKIGIQLIYSKLDLELPIYEVNDSFVNYFQLLWNVNNFINKNEIKFALPLHLRYRKPNHDTKYEIISINPPSLSLICLNDVNYNSNNYNNLIDNINNIKQMPYNLVLFNNNMDINDKNIVLINSTNNNYNLRKINKQQYYFPNNNNNKNLALPKMKIRAPNGDLNYEIIASIVTLFSLIIVIYYLIINIKSYSPKKNLLSPPNSPTSLKLKNKNN